MNSPKQVSKSSSESTAAPSSASASNRGSSSGATKSSIDKTDSMISSTNHVEGDLEPFINTSVTTSINNVNIDSFNHDMAPVSLERDEPSVCDNYSVGDSDPSSSSFFKGRSLKESAVCSNAHGKKTIKAVSSGAGIYMTPFLSRVEAFQRRREQRMRKKVQERMEQEVETCSFRPILFSSK